MDHIDRNFRGLNFATALLSFSAALISLGVLILPNSALVWGWVTSTYGALDRFGWDRLIDLFIAVPLTVVMIRLSLHADSWKWPLVGIYTGFLLLILVRIAFENSVPDFMSLVGAR